MNIDKKITTAIMITLKTTFPKGPSINYGVKRDSQQIRENTIFDDISRGRILSKSNISEKQSEVNTDDFR